MILCGLLNRFGTGFLQQRVGWRPPGSSVLRGSEGLCAAWLDHWNITGQQFDMALWWVSWSLLIHMYWYGQVEVDKWLVTSWYPFIPGFNPRWFSQYVPLYFPLCEIWNWATAGIPCRALLGSGSLGGVRHYDRRVRSPGPSPPVLGRLGRLGPFPRGLPASASMACRWGLRFLNAFNMGMRSVSSSVLSVSSFWSIWFP